MEENRIGVAAIIIDNPDSVQEVNEALHKFSRLIVISVVLDGTTDDISALTGKLGKISGVTVKAAVSKK